ncbi:MAG TPA: hypothetical protein VLJ76_00065 [Gaiellaceae bacterium]|nr:hypothetical protein [Gaiellaceae bacterium]
MPTVFGVTLGKEHTMDRFNELDNLVLHLKGLVLVRDLRSRNGAAADELEMFGAEIDRTRDRLATFFRRSESAPAAAA